MTWLTVTEYLCHKCPRTCFVCRNHNLILSSSITYHRVCNKSNTTGATLGAGTVYSSQHLSSPTVFSWVLVARYLVFYEMFCRSLFVHLSVFF